MSEGGAWLAGLTSGVAVMLCGIAIMTPDRPAPEPIDAATPDVMVTVTVTATPEPAPTVTVTRTAKPAARSERKDVWSRYPAWVKDFAACVIAHESLHAGIYKAENPISTASGAFQFVDGTWQHYARQLGYRYTHASDAPPAVQDHVFAHAATDSKAHWNGTGC